MSERVNFSERVRFANEIGRLKEENAKLRELAKDLLNAWDDMQHGVVTGPTFDDCECRAYELGIEVDA